jgi:cytochrome P450
MRSLREAINDLVEQRLQEATETGKFVDVPDLASEMAESLADLIVCSARPEEQPRLVTHVLTALNRFLAEKRQGGVRAQLQ